MPYMETKICKACNESLDTILFHIDSRSADGYYGQCKICREELTGKASRQRAMSKKRDLVRQAKDKPCMDCGKNFPTECMDFDHRSDKLFNIGNSLARHGYQTIRDEINKCDIVCACCHRIRSAKVARAKRMVT